MNVDFKLNLGDEVRCKITGYKGVIVCQSHWLHNCNTYGVKSHDLKDGKPLDAVFFDEPSLELIEEKTMIPKRDTGGPCVSIPQTNR